MRDWHLTARDPLTMRFAADARLQRTDYADDQSWEISFGGGQEPALSFQTRYGGRAGLARIVPMWVLDGRAVYEGGAILERPTLRAFTPNYARITAKVSSTLGLTAELWVMESHAVGGRFTLQNTGSSPVTPQFEIFAQVVREGQIVEMNLLGLENGSEALHLGEIGNLNPILMLERAVKAASADDDHVSPKLSTSLSLPPGASASVRWVHAGYPSRDDSLRAAYQWLYQTNWDAAIAQIERTNAALPEIETGNADWDVAIALGNQVLLRSFLSPTTDLPFASFVNARIPSRGSSPRHDGSDHGWQWSGQTAALGYLTLPSVAMLAPDLAMGAIRNALAVQKDDGWIDFKPGLGGQRANLLSLPLLASTAWRIYEIVEDRAFIEAVFPGLLKFVERWFQPDMDHDQDGLPEWTTATQSGYPDNPTFARYRRWARNADINKAESTDLAAYLIGEIHSLQQMAALLNQDSTAKSLQTRLDALVKQLNSLWNESAHRYQYRDRDTHLVSVGKRLFQGKGDDAFDSGAKLDPPNRLILRVIGGKDHAPRVSVTIEGIDAKGKHVAETIPTSAFAWHYGMGSVVSENAYSQINYVKFEGVSRVYSTEIETVDLTGDNQTQLLPLWAQTVDAERAERLIQAATDSSRYWRPFGLTVCPVDDPAYAADNDGGSGGVWMLWNVLITEGFLHNGAADGAMTLFSRLMDAQIRALRRDRAFREVYNSETGDGLGDLDELGGIVPLWLTMQMIGLRIVNRRRVWAGGTFAFSNPVKVSEAGVEVTRSKMGTAIRFPSGYTAQVGAEWQLIEDPTPEPPSPAALAPVVPVVAPPTIPEAPQPTLAVEPTATGSIIPVDARKTDTMEIPVNLIDFGKPIEPIDLPTRRQESDPKSSTKRDPDTGSGTGSGNTGRSGGIKIPVKGPDDQK